MNIVIAIGGSVVNPQDGVLNVEPYAATIEHIVEAGHNVSVVVGGGATARSYIDEARQWDSSESTLDRLGIAASRLNARAFEAAVDDTYGPTFRTAPEEAAEETLDVFGGNVPGHTTDAVAGLVAEETGADTVIYVTNVDGIYTANPEDSEAAERYDVIGYEELTQLIAESPRSAGSPAPVDLLAVKILQRSDIRGLVIEGDNGKSLAEVIFDDAFAGTVIGD